MGLYARLIGGALIGEHDVPIGFHEIKALMAEIEKGKISPANAAAALQLTPAEQVEAQTLFDRIVTPLESISLGGVVTLTNVGATYDANAISQGLPFLRIQTAGITAFEFTVRSNKVGTGTQSWQLWNETDGAEITVINDNGAAGIKTPPLSVVHNFPSALQEGFKTIRIRAKSTTAADDPVFLGAALLISRVERLTAEDFHEVLILARAGFAYNTEETLKARLGVA